MKEKPLLALNLLWAALAIGAFFAGSMVTKHRMSRSAESDTRAKDTRPGGLMASGQGESTIQKPGERARPADDSALGKKFTQRVVILSSRDFGTLAKTDLDEAKRVWSLVEDQETRRKYASLIASALINRDLDAALAFAAEESCLLACGELAYAVYKRRGTEALLAWIDTIEYRDEDSAQLRYKQLASRKAVEFLASENPERAREWVIANAGQPHLDGYTLQSIAGAVDKYKNPINQFNWLVELPITGKVHTEAMAAVFSECLRSDLDAAGQWLAAQELQPIHDWAIAKFAYAAATIDLEGAQVWAEQISDESLRMKTLKRLASKIE
jgi:hypothetical protein